MFETSAVWTLTVNNVGNWSAFK